MQDTTCVHIIFWPSPLASDIVYTGQVFCKALVGVTLKDSEFLKLEQTHLADIIAEEDGNEHFRAASADVSMHRYVYVFRHSTMLCILLTD